MSYPHSRFQLTALEECRIRSAAQLLRDKADRIAPALLQALRSWQPGNANMHAFVNWSSHAKDELHNLTAAVKELDTAFKTPARRAKAILSKRIRRKPARPFAGSPPATST